MLNPSKPAFRFLIYRLMGNKGLTLIEIIISMLIITVISAGMFGSFVGTQYFFNRARHRIQAFNFAREAVDKLRSNYKYTDSQMSIKNGHLESEIGTIIRGEMTNLNSSLTYDVSEPETDGYKAVTVTVTWDETTL